MKILTYTFPKLLISERMSRFFLSFIQFQTKDTKSFFLIPSFISYYTINLIAFTSSCKFVQFFVSLSCTSKLGTHKIIYIPTNMQMLNVLKQSYSRESIKMSYQLLKCIGTWRRSKLMCFNFAYLFFKLPRNLSSAWQ